VTPARVARIERATLVLGFALIVIALLAVDWRLGFLAAGLVLVAASLDWRLPR
jgi:hypothetical protein